MFSVTWQVVLKESDVDASDPSALTMTEQETGADTPSVTSSPFMVVVRDEASGKIAQFAGVEPTVSGDVTGQLSIVVLVSGN